MDSPLSITVGARMSAFLNSAEDFHKYRKRLNKTILRLRHELNLVTRDTKNYKDKERISKISSEDYSNDERFGLILLLTAERDLVYSLEIKSMMEISSEGSSSYKNLMVSRLKKSVSSTKQLLQVVENETNELKIIEVYVYAALNEGSLAVNKRKWQSALNAFSIARCALEYLYSQQTDQEQEQFNKTVINDLIETLVDPSLALSVSQIEELDMSDLKSTARRHCHDKTLPYLQTVVELIKKKDPEFVSQISSSIKLIDSITWRSHEASLYNDEIAFKLMELTKPEVNEYDNLEAFDQLISGWSGVLELHQADLNKNEDEDDSEKIQNRAVLLTYINYSLLFTRIRRDQILVGQLLGEFEEVSKTRKLVINKDITRLYSSSIRTIDEIKELPGVYNDDDLMESLDTMSQFYSYSILVRLSNSFLLNNKYLESLKVLNTIKEKIGINGLSYKVETFPYSVSSNDNLEQFKADINKTFLKTQILAQFSFELNKNPHEAVIENMHQFPGSSKLVNVGTSPVIKPILSKPVLFDVAFNYINYPGGSSKSSSVEPQSAPPQTAGEEESKKKLGLFGFLGRS
ncbi:signal recognition particle subunit srp68 [Yamadazyma tenuis]|uniref:Signal recognition particle subunit SRP68 n=1 Tax=Candida tenuis (strain ATCC 10573 / BCRC 21748 / CBS 615 / JCM 9827 / NBRC 10315 / NRRL Y-1498 / VKM Y-70) TaxID=590646 RepID=G3BF01_CANTC|nr:uncharacterized protein CANTEDRAFT_116003 [Yamadazyma tenuis ATCC 10573]XP_006690184.1 uncharacterized protein CANTEDRAFT_116003 [Yamadazyma tenuis ATCC 10573]EGV60969.1 hypothetical protein CANTEDRAFT_116003 [Yamadazyma tenuis ATCC 10573]EGV60970.1 hypothetical protein CANTEDRAFT_116003 [Yamadazyma tenuis ATCC 10573]WEJ94794.1 signal recognition particle subunit srp68 [Yamadazyma tenuis]